MKSAQQRVNHIDGTMLSNLLVAGSSTPAVHAPMPQGGVSRMMDGG